MTATTSAGSSASSGQVTLVLSKQRYGAEDPVLVTIHNGLNQPIWIQDGGPSCEAVVLERLANGTWEAAGHCIVAGRARSTSIAAGATLARRFDCAQGMDTGAGWPAGTYRVTLAYALSESGAAAASGTMVPSAEFTVG